MINFANHKYNFLIIKLEPSTMDDNVSFRFKQFSIADARCGMKVGTDGVIAGALASLPRPRGTVADVGAGCGIIALMIAQRYPEALVIAVEIDPHSCVDLRRNVEASRWKSRISVVEGCFTALDGKFDLIVSNPPFFTSGEKSPLASRAKARHTSELSPSALITFGAGRLADGGRLAMILPVESASDIETQAVFARLSLVRRIDISTSRRRGVTRSFLEFTNLNDVAPVYETLETSGEEFHHLTKDFYLDS